MAGVFARFEFGVPDTAVEDFLYGGEALSVDAREVAVPGGAPDVFGLELSLFEVNLGKADKYVFPHDDEEVEVAIGKWGLARRAVRVRFESEEVESAKRSRVRGGDASDLIEGAPQRFEGGAMREVGDTIETFLTASAELGGGITSTAVGVEGTMEDAFKVSFVVVRGQESVAEVGGHLVPRHFTQSRLPRLHAGR